MAGTDWERKQYWSGDLVLEARVAGPEDGPLVILLHGFPEFWYGWRKQIGPLVTAGFRVVAPDQRGYNRSSKPQAVRDYDMRLLVGDVLALVRQEGRERAFLVGHDWGALVAWRVAALHPERVERLVIINVPHPALLPRFLMTRPRQLLRSWYMFFFQLPWLPERLFRFQNFRSTCESLLRTSRPGTFSSEDLEQYRQAWAQPGAARSMIHWYRALFRRPRAIRIPEVSIPVLILWGRRDAFLLPELAEASLRYCRDGHLQAFEEATHWLQHEEPEAVNAAIVRFLRAA